MDTLIILLLTGAAIYFVVRKLVLDQRCVSCHRPRVARALACPYCGATYPSQPTVAGTARLVALNGTLQGREFPLQGAQFEIGSQSGTHLQLPDGAVAAYHAVVASQHGQFVLYDRHTSSGTFVNGRPVAQYVLRPGDRIQIGGTVLAFRVDRPQLTLPNVARGGMPLAPPNWIRLESGVRALPRPRQISGGGALLALLCFFLPWISVSCGNGVSISASGWTLATAPQASGGNSSAWLLLLVPLAALAVLWLLYRVLNGDASGEAGLSKWELVAGGAGLAPLVLLFIGLEQARSDPRNLGLGALIQFELGYWLTWVGFSAVIAGGWMEQRSKQP